VRQVLRADWDTGALTYMEIVLWRGLKRVDVAVKVEASDCPCQAPRTGLVFPHLPVEHPSGQAHLNYESNGGFIELSDPRRASPAPRDRSSSARRR